MARPPKDDADLGLMAAAACRMLDQCRCRPGECSDPDFEHQKDLWWITSFVLHITPAQMVALMRGAAEVMPVTVTGAMAVQMQLGLEDAKPGEPIREKWQRVWKHAGYANHLKEG